MKACGQQFGTYREKPMAAPSNAPAMTRSYM
jgi:hypothetical protein